MGNTVENGGGTKKGDPSIKKADEKHVGKRDKKGQEGPNLQIPTNTEINTNIANVQENGAADPNQKGSLSSLSAEKEACGHSARTIDQSGVANNGTQVTQENKDATDQSGRLDINNQSTTSTQERPTAINSVHTESHAQSTGTTKTKLANRKGSALLDAFRKITQRNKQGNNGVMGKPNKSREGMTTRSQATKEPENYSIRIQESLLKNTTKDNLSKLNISNLLSVISQKEDPEEQTKKKIEEHGERPARAKLSSTPFKPRPSREAEPNATREARRSEPNLDTIEVAPPEDCSIILGNYMNYETLEISGESEESMRELTDDIPQPILQPPSPGGGREGKKIQQRQIQNGRGTVEQRLTQILIAQAVI